MENKAEELRRLLASLEENTGRRPQPQASEDVPILDLSEENVTNQVADQHNPPTENETAKKLLELLARNLTGSSRNDGDPTPTPGPCKCGYKHWLEGKEYDFVFKIETTKGGLVLGFNATDNPYTVAADFIAKHRLNERSLDDTRLISAIANEILDMTENSRHHSLDTPMQATTDLTSSSWNPYQSHTTLAPAGTHSMLNPKTGKWESIVSPLEMRAREDSEEGKKRQQLLEEKKKIRAMKEQKEKEKERIRLQILQSKQEKMLEERRREEERKIQKVASLHEGVLTWRAPTNLADSEALEYSKARNEKDERGEKGEILSGGDTATYKSKAQKEDRNYENEDEDEDEDEVEDEDEDDDDEDNFKELLERARSEYDSTRTPKQRVVGLNSIREQEAEEIPTPTRKEDWLKGGLPLLNYKYQNLGELKFIGALDNSGFGRVEIQNFVRILRILKSRTVSTPSVDENAKKKSSSWGKGQSLRDSENKTTIESSTDAPPQDSTQLSAQPLSVDRTKPTTSIAIRLPTGQRLLVECNLSHTIADLHSHILAHAPSNQPFVLVSAFPRKVYSDLNATVEASKLANQSLSVQPQ